MFSAALRFSSRGKFDFRVRAANATVARPRMGLVLHDFALGGTERIAVRLANKWSDLGVDVVLFCGVASGPLRDLLHPSVQVAGPPEQIGRGRGATRQLGKAARDYFLDHPVDAIFVPGNTHWPVVKPLSKLPEARRPRIIAQISAELVKPRRNPLRQQLFGLRTRQRLHGADHIVSMCWDAARKAALMTRRTDIAVIPLPALGDRREPATTLIGEAHPVVFAASRLFPGKGIEHLVRAFAQVRHPTARLVIAGSGPNEQAVRRLVAELGLATRVGLLGYLPDVRPSLDRASFFVMPSEHEGYGAVIVEALAAGRPVLATACSPAVSELLDDPAAGLVVPVGDVQALARGIDEMLERAPADPGALAARVERFRIGPVARRYLSLVGITPGLNGQPARLLVAANDVGRPTADCAVGQAGL